MTFHPFGDSALLINFEQKIDTHINQKVIGLAQKIQSSNWQEIIFLTPAYCSLTIGYNSEIISYARLVKKVKIILDKSTSAPDQQSRTLKIPVCYVDEFALDMVDIMAKTDLPKEQIIMTHTSRIYHIYMLGFIPGFPYMGTLPDALNCSRKEIPRLRVPAQSVGIAGNQTGIYPLEAPGGWQIIGKTPVNIFDGRKEQPFLFKAGDNVIFEAIDMDTFYKIKEEDRDGKFKLESLYA